MLRITKRPLGNGNPDTMVTVLEGRLLGPWVAELSRVVYAGATAPGPLRIDLSGLEFADEEGARLIRELRQAGAELTGASGFVAALIGGDDGEDGNRG